MQGCSNDRPFAGYTVGHLRIVRAGSGPGPIVNEVRLYVATVDVVWTSGRTGALPDRPLDFASLPPAPRLFAGLPTDEAAPPNATRNCSADQGSATRAAK